MVSCKRGFLITILILSVYAFGAAQPTVPDREVLFMEVLEASKKNYGVNPLLQNGVFYENRYMTAQGHPFLLDDTYKNGFVSFRKSRYEGVRLKYDVFTQQVVISHEQEGLVLQNYLSNEFIDSFSIDGKNFEQVAFEDEPPGFYQAVFNEDDLACYYQWYKTRTESHEAGAYKIYVFSEDKLRRYLLIDGLLKRYRNNRSFVKAFPKGTGRQIRVYLKEQGIKVDRADDQTMQTLLHICTGIMKEHNN
jgi:hypothetical protein